MWNCIWTNVQNSVFPFSRLFPLYPQVSVLQNSVSDLLCGKCALVWFFPLSLFFIFWQISGAFPFGPCQIINSGCLGRVWCSGIWNSPVPEAVLCQCRQEGMEHQAWVWPRAVCTICHKTFNINLLNAPSFKPAVLKHEHFIFCVCGPISSQNKNKIKIFLKKKSRECCNEVKIRNCIKRMN